jgi:hypothetical protein
MIWLVQRGKVYRRQFVMDCAAPVAGDLHRSGVQVAGFRVPGCGAVPLQQKGADTVTSQLQGGGEADGAAADYEDRD